jgi:hypothetical protein
LLNIRHDCSNENSLRERAGMVDVQVQPHCKVWLNYLG